MMKIDRFFYGCVFIASLCLIGWAGTGSNILLGIASFLTCVAMVTLIIVDTRRRGRQVKEITDKIDGELLVHETEMFLIIHEAAKQGVFICPRCIMASYNPDDLREGYCGRCHDFTGPKYPDSSDFGA